MLIYTVKNSNANTLNNHTKSHLEEEICIEPSGNAPKRAQKESYQLVLIKLRQIKISGNSVQKRSRLDIMFLFSFSLFVHWRLASLLYFYHRMKLILYILNVLMLITLAKDSTGGAKGHKVLKKCAEDTVRTP